MSSSQAHYTLVRAFPISIHIKRHVTDDIILPAVGIIGTTVMPHSLFLGSALATQNRLASVPIPGASKKSKSGTDTDTERTASSRSSLYLAPPPRAATPTPKPAMHVRIIDVVRGAVRTACRVPEP
ncbi:hypothetical protein H0H81_010640, partial [Sphagnurus paluster]